MKLWELCQSSETGKEALEMQSLVSLADRVQLKMGVRILLSLTNVTIDADEVLPDTRDEDATAQAVRLQRCFPAPAAIDGRE